MPKVWRSLFGRRAGIEARYLVGDDYFSDFSATSLSAFRQYYGGGSGIRGEREEIENSFTGYVQSLYKSDGIVFACMTARQLVFSEARFQFRRMRDGRPGDLFGTSALAVLERPWPNCTTGELLARMVADVDLAGNAYVVNEGTRLRRLRPDWVQIVLTAPPEVAVDSDVAGYAYWPGGIGRGMAKFYLPEEMCHWSPVPDPDASYRGMSALTPVVREIFADQAASTHKLAFFRNGATLGPIFRVKETVNLAQFKEFIEATNAAHQGTENAYKPLYVGGGADVTLGTADMQQLDFRGVVGAGETRIAAALRVHPVIVGLSEGMQSSALNAGNYAAAKRNFVDGTIRPLWRSVSAALGSIVSVPAGAELWFDDRDIAYLREDAKDIAQIQTMQMAAMSSAVTNGWDPDAAIQAVLTNDLSVLLGRHSGLFSVQLQPPMPEGPQPVEATASVRRELPAGESGSAAPGGGAAPKAGAARAALNEPELLARAWDPEKHPRDPVTGRFISAAAFADLIKKLDNDRNSSFDERMKDAHAGDAALEAAPYKQWLEPSGPHRDAVYDYRGGGYIDINNALRIGRTGRTSQTRESIRRLDEAMADSPLGADVRVHRGIRDPRAVFGDSWNDTDVSGLEWKELGFASSSANLAQTGRTYFTGTDGVRMEILVPKGTHALAASQVGEAELLLDRGLRYRVVHDGGVVGGIRRLFVEVVND